jgi:predicted metal-dependent hydrolase
VVVSKAAPEILPERRVAFEYPDDLDPCWNQRFPEFAYAANSVSLIMPYAEPYFVKSVRAALPQLDPELQAATRPYLTQELGHHVQHRRFNDVVGRRYPAVRRVERWMARTYGWLSRTRSLRFNLAFAAGSETIAYGIARWSEKHLTDLFSSSDPVASTMYLWHLAEEIEHKSAAFDVYQAVDGSRLRYAAAMTTSFAILVWFCTIASLTMLASDRRLHHPVAWYRLIKWSFSLAFSLLPTMAVSAMPGHRPADFADPVFLPTWLQQFDPATGTLPVWDGHSRVEFTTTGEPLPRKKIPG